MKVSVLQENLSRGLNIVSRAVSSRSSLPITQNVLLETDRSMLKLSATNLEIAVTTWIGAMIYEEGSTTIPSRLLSDFVNSLPADRVDFDTEPDSDILRLECGRDQARIHGAPAKEFPPIPKVDEGATAQVSAGEFKKSISRVGFAAASEDSRPVLTGIQAQLTEDRYTLAAADGFRLAVQRGTLAQPVAEDISVIIPAKTLAELSRLLTDPEETLHIMMAPARAQIMFKYSGIEVVSLLVSGTFPNYEQLIPQKYDALSVADAGSLLRLVRSAAIFARGGSDIIRLEMFPAENQAADDAAPDAEAAPTGAAAGPRIQVSARSEEIGENHAAMDLQGQSGDPVKIAFNSKFLQEVLTALDHGDLALETTSASSPGVFKPKDDDSYVHVIMPMFVQW